jgi:membrane-bound lytic murein transglycosylase B
MVTRRLLMRLGALVAAAGAVLYGFYGLASADYEERADVAAFVDEMVKSHGFAKDPLLALFAHVERKQAILDAIARPAEKTKAWHEYREIFVTPERIAQGLEFRRTHAATLKRAEEVYGVPVDVIVAIIGVETRYGRNTGSYRVADALTTLAFDYPPRGAFFRQELAQFLLLAREEGVDPLSLTGSYAGAMGYGQFIPSSFRAYSVDFDGDGKRDIWSNPVDAIGSVANYFKRHGWRANGPVVVRADPIDGRVDGIANDALALDHTVGKIRGLGVELPGYPDEEPALLLRLDGAEGPEYWVGLHNFYVITRYNRSAMYALAVHQLGESIASAANAVAVNGR